MDIIYNTDFYEGQKMGSKRSAEALVPYILEIYENFFGKSIKSVVDFGYETGSWLTTFIEKNSNIDIYGLDFGEPDSKQCFIDANIKLQRRIYLKKLN